MPTENLEDRKLSATALDSALRVIPSDIVNVDGISINGFNLRRQVQVAFAKAAAYDRDRATNQRTAAEATRLNTVLEHALDAMDPSQLHPDGDTETDQLRRAYNVVYEGLGLHEEVDNPQMTMAEYRAEHGYDEEQS